MKSNQIRQKKNKIKYLKLFNPLRAFVTVCFIKFRKKKYQLNPK